MPQQLCSTGLTSLDLFPCCLCSWGQEGAARVDDILDRQTDRQIERQTEMVFSLVFLDTLVLRWSKMSYG